MDNFILERTLITTLGNKIHIKSNNLKAKSHFDNNSSYADFIINQINNDKIYNEYLKGDNLIIFDIGANIGLFSLHCIDCASIIYSFEPTPSHFELLSEFTKEYKNIIPVNVAISDCDSDIDFFLCDYNTTMNSIVNNHNNGKLNVKGRSIISFIKENNIEKIDFIKCDIEGSEIIALKIECIKDLFHIVDKWFIEVHSTCNSNTENNRDIIANNFESIGYNFEKIGFDTLYIFKPSKD
jgi:FkbM family methyltransferase